MLLGSQLFELLDSRWYLQVHFKSGLFVKIKRCSEEEAGRIFAAARNSFNRSMAQFLGSGGEVARPLSNSCVLFTPDRSDTWSWPHTMLEPLQCRANHHLQLTQRSSVGSCNGCASELSAADSTHRCQECDFDLCAECAKKQARRQPQKYVVYGVGSSWRGLVTVDSFDSFSSAFAT